MSYRNDATLNGVRPKKGLWIVHAGRGKAYGPIQRVLRDGTVVWEGSYGQSVPTKPETLIDGGYSYERR